MEVVESQIFQGLDSHSRMASMWRKTIATEFGPECAVSDLNPHMTAFEAVRFLPRWPNCKFIALWQWTVPLNVRYQSHIHIHLFLRRHQCSKVRVISSHPYKFPSWGGMNPPESIKLRPIHLWQRTID